MATGGAGLVAATGGKENDLQLWDTARPDATPIFKARNVRQFTVPCVVILLVINRYLTIISTSECLCGFEQSDWSLPLVTWLPWQQLIIKLVFDMTCSSLYATPIICSSAYMTRDHSVDQCTATPGATPPLHVWTSLVTDCTLIN